MGNIVKCIKSHRTNQQTAYTLIYCITDCDWLMSLNLLVTFVFVILIGQWVLYLLFTQFFTHQARHGATVYLGRFDQKTNSLRIFNCTENSRYHFCVINHFSTLMNLFFYF